MKFSTVLVSALMGLAANALTIPAAAGIEKRQAASTYDLISTLYTDVQQYTGLISTLSLTPLFPTELG